MKGSVEFMKKKIWEKPRMFTLSAKELSAQIKIAARSNGCISSNGR